MSAHPEALDYWLNWKPKAQNSAEVAKTEPTEPTKPGSVGFVDAEHGRIQKIEPDPDQNDRSLSAERSQAWRLMNLAGVRIIRQGSSLILGVWKDLDVPELRGAICMVGMGSRLIVHLETADVPVKYKVRSCPDRRKDESFAFWLRRAEQANPQLVALYREAATI